jgi:hypothetical protein
MDCKVMVQYPILVHGAIIIVETIGQQHTWMQNANAHAH